MNDRPRIAALLLAAALWLPPSRGEPEVHVLPTADPTFPELPAAIPLWAQGAPGSGGRSSPPRTHWEHFDTTWYPVVSDVEVPALLPFLPATGAAPRPAVIVCPGGGHKFLAMEHEGYSVGTWLAEHGVAAFVLEYRLAMAPGSPYQVEVHSLMDAQRAIRTVRGRAREWNIDPARIGVIGFSAGGEVAALAATRFTNPVKGSSDATDALDCRPDFQALFYPGLTPVPSPAAGTPPAFLCAASDDQGHLAIPMVQYSLRLAEAGVPVELHVYARGGHGFGIRNEDKPVYTWMPLFKAWIGTLGAPAKP